MRKCNPIFIIFNIIFGLNGWAMIGGAIYLIIKMGFKSLSFIMIIIGIVIILIFFLGFQVNKGPILFIYLLFVMIIFLSFAALSVILKLFTQILIDFIKPKVNDFKEAEINKIKEKNINLLVFIVTCVVTACSLFAFISGVAYKCRHKKGNKKENDNLEDQAKAADPILGIDYEDNNIDNRTN